MGQNVNVNRQQLSMDRLSCCRADERQETETKKRGKFGFSREDYKNLPHTLQTP